MAEQKLPRDENRIAAMKRERAGYLARGDEARAKMVADELAKYGEKVDGGRAESDPLKEPPRNRQAASHQTAEDGAKRATRPARRADQDAG